MKYRKVCAFAKKWIAVFQNPNIRELEISENQKFAQDCFSLGFPMDCGQAFERMYPGIHLGNADELQRVIDTVDDIRLLGSAIFSRWRYYNHWAMGARIVSRNRPYQTEEGCLSFMGGPVKTTRYDEIEVEYLDANFKPKKDKFSGFTAQIIQHELDHVEGGLI